MLMMFLGVADADPVVASAFGGAPPEVARE
jgi:hypothetical protein